MKDALTKEKLVEEINAWHKGTEWDRFRSCKAELSSENYTSYNGVLYAYRLFKSYNTVCAVLVNFQRPGYKQVMEMHVLNGYSATTTSHIAKVWADEINGDLTEYNRYNWYDTKYRHIHRGNNGNFWYKYRHNKKCIETPSTENIDNGINAFNSLKAVYEDLKTRH